MYFANLPDNIKNSIKSLTVDQVFQDRFGKDEVLDELDSIKVNKAEEYQLLQLVLHNNLNNTFFRKLTPAVWCFLWIVESPFVTNAREITELDTDIMLYVMDNGVNETDPEKILNNSIGYTKKLKKSYDEALVICQQSIRLNFKPLTLFPRTKALSEQEQVKSKPLFDVDWLTSIVVRVQSVTGLKPLEIMTELSLAECCFYFAQYGKLNGDKSIHRRTPEEILEMQDKRCCELIADRLVELNIISADEVNKYIQMMCNKTE